MESFTSIEDMLFCVVQEANCCLANMSGQYVANLNHGQDNEEQYWKILQLEAYLGAFDRYLEEAKCRCGDKPRVINPSPKPCLNPQINSVPLGIESVDCRHCLTEREVLKMVEVVKIFCSTCNCNCN